MKQEKMIRYMNLIDSKYIAEADPANAKNITKRKSRTSLILRYGALAASFVLVVGVLLAMPYLQHDDPVFPDQEPVYSYGYVRYCGRTGLPGCNAVK